MLNLKSSQVHSPVLDIDGRTVPLKLVRNKRAKRLILKVEHSTGEVVVVGPSDRSLKKAVQFATQEKAWIAKSLASVPERLPFRPGALIPLRGRTTQIIHTPKARAGVVYDEVLDALFVSGDPEFVPRRVQDFLKREARKDLAKEVARLCQALGQSQGQSQGQILDPPHPKISVRDTITRWGSCSATGGLSFSWRLILAEPHVLSYVAAHEVAHLIHMNHSKRFWALVLRIYGPYEGPEEWLNKEGALLHRYGNLKGAS